MYLEQHLPAKPQPGASHGGSRRTGLPDDCEWDFDARVHGAVHCTATDLAICETNMKVIQEHFIQLNVNSSILCLKGRE